jgi:hypothetical protein
MKRFYTICGALVVGSLLVGPVHAEPANPGKHTGQHAGKHAGQHAGKHAAHQARHQSGRHWRMHRTKPGQLPWQWLPEQDPGSYAYDPEPGAYAPAGGTEDPGAGGYEPINGANLPGGDIGGRPGTRPPGTPEAGGQPRLPGSGNNSPGMPGSGARR